MGKVTTDISKVITDMSKVITDFITDFYEYACGGWLKKNVVPEDKSRYSIFSQAKENLELKLKRE